MNTIPKKIKNISMKKSKLIVILGLLVILFGGSAFYLGKNSPIIKKIAEIQSFVKNLPNTQPDYLGEIVSKDGNLLTIKYFNKSDTPLTNFSNRRELMKTMQNISIEEKIAMGEKLQQKVLGTITVLVPLNTLIYVKKNSPKLLNFAELQNGDFIVIWGNLNPKGQVISDFILTANPKNYEK